MYSPEDTSKSNKTSLNITEQNGIVNFFELEHFSKT